MTATTDENAAGSTISSVGRVDAPVRIDADRYISADYAAREAEELWPRVWQIACSLDHVARPGDYFVYEVGALSVLIVRDTDGELRAFQNVCLHRGNELCSGSGGGLTELRCGFHRWSWTLDGRLREVPSRKGFGTLRNDDYPLIEASVDVWGPTVWVNLDPDAESLAQHLAPLPEDSAWAMVDDFRCSALLTTALRCNWKTLIDGFSETYHVQGIHREMLPMVDDVNSPQVIWADEGDGHVGKLLQPYGLPSPRLRDVDRQTVWEGFVEIMGGRLGVREVADAGPCPEIPDGSTLRDVLADRIREHTLETTGVDLSLFATEHLMDLSQYNVFPNVTVLVFADMLQIVKSRPGPTPDQCFMDVMAFTRAEPGAPAGTIPPTVTMAKGDVDLGLVLNQDVDNIEQAQRGLHQPGFTHLSLSGEECRIINLHRNLDRYLPASS